MKVTFVAGTLGQGGAERQLYYNIKTLRQCGTGVRVLCLTEGEFWQSRIEALGVPVVWVGQSRGKIGRLRRIVAELRRDRPDVVQSQHLYTNLYVVVAARILGLREVGAIRNDSGPEVRDCGPIMGPLSFRIPHVIAANSRTAIRNAHSRGLRRRRFLFLPNVVDTDEFQPIASQETRVVSLVLVGRLVPQKRPDRFLSVVARLVEQSSRPIRAVIVGSGPEERALREQANRLGLLSNVVTFEKTVGDVLAIYQRSDVLVLTSDYEGTPNVVMEAMACGLPVVAMRCGDVPELVQHGETGYVIEPGDEKSMTDSLLRLIEDPDRRKLMGGTGRTRIEATRSLRGLPALLQSFYGAAIS